MECLAGSQLADLLNGSATPALASHIDAHVDLCADCRQLLLNLAWALSSPPSSLSAIETAAPAGAEPADHVQSRRNDPIGRRHRILGLLGEGGMGRVHLAYDRLLGTDVALKQVLRPSRSVLWRSHSAISDVLADLVSQDRGGQLDRQPGPAPESRSQVTQDTLAHLKTLAEEFRTLATLHHPHIVRVFDYGFDGAGRPFFTMELLSAAQPLLEFARGRSLVEQAELIVQHPRCAGLSAPARHRPPGSDLE